MMKIAFRKETPVTTVSRRTFLKGTVAGSVLAVAAGAGLLAPRRVLADTWPAAAFGQKTAEGALYTYAWDIERTNLEGVRRKELMACPMNEEPLRLEVLGAGPLLPPDVGRKRGAGRVHRQPLEVHLLAHAINNALGNVGKTLELLPPPKGRYVVAPAVFTPGMARTLSSRPATNAPISGRKTMAVSSGNEIRATGSTPRSPPPPGTAGGR